MRLALQTPQEGLLSWAAAGGPEYRFLLPRSRFRELIDAVADMVAGEVAIGIGHSPTCPCHSNSMLPQSECRCDVVRITLQLQPVQR